VTAILAVVSYKTEELLIAKYMKQFICGCRIANRRRIIAA
jgi:hypothetical protein